MGLKNMSLMADATLSSANGTALSFVDNGITIQNGVQVVASSDTDYTTRRSITFKYRPPAFDTKLQLFNKDKKSVVAVFPMVDNKGRVIFNTLRIEREVHPETSAEDCARMNNLGAQILGLASSVESFWTVGSLS